ncbi:hypothetical protein N0V90_005021 [Kalmusia sp. IMI 367209]|nr:hypothetical protein N0V90_005021 [Kalmusia sp. IMI 367209]
MEYTYSNITFEIKGKIGIIKFLNSFSEKLQIDLLTALRELAANPETIFTVLTGEGRFFSAGADVRAFDAKSVIEKCNNHVEKKLAFLAHFAFPLEIMRSVIDHPKVFVLALNGPGVGGGASWFQGLADVVLAAQGAYLQVPFNALGLVPENGATTILAESIGVHRANDFLMFGRKVTVEEFEQWGLINHILPREGFHGHVLEFLEAQLKVNDGKSMIETKRLQNLPLRGSRILAVYNAVDALAERFAEGTPIKIFEKRKAELEAKSKKAKL